MMNEKELESYIDDINKVMGFKNTTLELRRKDFKEDEAMRQHIKLLLNSALGKLNQKKGGIKTKFFRSMDEIQSFFNEKKNEIIDLTDLESACQINYKSEDSSLKRQSNPILYAFITANARIFLHQNILKLVKHNFLPFYTDTDSILFSGPKNANLPLNFGGAFRQFKHEFKEDTEIMQFTARGRKNFWLSYSTPNELENQICIKVCGLNFSSHLLRKTILSNTKNDTKNPTFSQIRHIFDKKLQTQISVKQTFELNTENYRCERRVDHKSPTLQTTPWGYLT